MAKQIEYRTIDGGKPAPYPDMTDEELSDFEAWAKEIEENEETHLGYWFLGAGFTLFMLIGWVLL